MKDIRCLFGCHIYNQAETKVVDERKGHLITRVRMCCLRCGKSFEDIIAIPFPEWLQRSEDGRLTMERTYYFKNAYVYIHFHNGNYDAYENVRELTFINDLVKIVVENEDGVLFADYYDRHIISKIQIVVDPKEN